MFDGVPEQLHQFIASSRTSLPLHLSFTSSLHHASSNPNNIFSTFDPYSTTTTTTTTTTPTSQQVPLQVQPHFLHPLHLQSATHQRNEEKQDNSSSGSLVAMNFEIERERSIPEAIDVDPAWSNDEVLTLLRIRSDLENWFPEFSWEHVSRKLEELGYKRSAEKCKEKFEEESRCFNNINYNKNYRFFSEFEELYHGQNPQMVADRKNKKMEKPREEDKMEKNLDEDSNKEQSLGDPFEDNEKSKSKKRKRHTRNFEIFKGFCEDIVKRMMAQQEQMHNKLLEDMVKRDEQKFAREEARKKQEMDRINKELEIRAYEQVIAGDRQAAIINFLKSLTSSGSSESQCFGGLRNEESLVKVLNSLNPPTSSSSTLAQNPNPTCQVNEQNNLQVPTSSTMTLGLQSSGSCSNIRNNLVTCTSLTENTAAQSPSTNLAPPTPKVPTSSAIDLVHQNPSSPNTQNKPLVPTSVPTPNAPLNGPINDKEDLGKRWPRDEVFALINLRCSLYNNGEEKEGTVAKTPLWERISQGMLELGYKRSAKRCKEKWENINKYFRKTKDTNKKRSLDSRTCPYFHQLSTLYNQGTLVAPSEGIEDRSAATPALPENHQTLSENQHGSSQGGTRSTTTTDSTMHVIAQGEKVLVQIPSAFDFEF